MWKHKKYGKRKYLGHYTRVRGERVFELVCTTHVHIVTFESWQAAKSLGWCKK